jgi:hypothetical protein
MYLVALQSGYDVLGSKYFAMRKRIAPVIERSAAACNEVLGARSIPAVDIPRTILDLKQTESR